MSFLLPVWECHFLSSHMITTPACSAHVAKGLNQWRSNAWLKKVEFSAFNLFVTLRLLWQFMGWTQNIHTLANISKDNCRLVYNNANTQVRPSRCTHGCWNASGIYSQEKPERIYRDIYLSHERCRLKCEVTNVTTAWRKWQDQCAV